MVDKTVKCVQHFREQERMPLPCEESWCAEIFGTLTVQAPALTGSGALVEHKQIRLGKSAWKRGENHDFLEKKTGDPRKFGLMGRYSRSKKKRSQLIKVI